MERVLMAMSGGVDSSVAAALLLEQDYEVIGATILVWSPPGVEMQHSDSCCGLSAAEDARRVCARLGIRHYTLDLRDEFYETIIRNYVDEYRQGRTPNPCIRCNEFIKFGSLLDRARSLGADKLATGHYARVRHDAERGKWLLLRGVDRRKEQSYALYRLTQEQLAHTLFPLGERTKGEVRARARELGLPTAGKPDSQETCFVPNNDYPALLQILVPDSLVPGELRDPQGRVVGQHPGIAHYTIGQRKRINVGSPVPLYVSRIDPAANAVTVASGDDPALYRQDVTAMDAVLTGTAPPEAGQLGPMQVSAKVRYNGDDQPAALTVVRSDQSATGLEMRVRFDEPVRAVTPGQSLVCYHGEEVVGGGIIAG